jgi:hypothetical protein
VVHRVGTPSSISGLVKCLSEKIVQALPLKHLSEQVVGVEICVAETSALTSFTSKRVVVLSLLWVTETLIGLANLFEGILRGWSVILVRVNFQG